MLKVAGVVCGAAAFAQIGTQGSTGTKIFSLVGKVKNTGLVEVLMGVTIGEIVNEIEGGHRAGPRLKRSRLAVRAEAASKLHPRLPV